MTEPVTTPPDGWSEASDMMPGAEQTYVYQVGDGERVLVGLASPSNNTDEIRLEVSSIEEAATIQRHDFVVATYDGKQEGVEDMISFMQLVSETLPSDHAEDERLFMAVQRCIEEFDASTNTWWSFFTR